MTRDCTYDWLLQLSVVYQLSYLLCSFVSVHQWHITIHHNQVIVALLKPFYIMVIFNISSNYIQCFLPIVSTFTYTFRINLNTVLKYERKSFYVEYLIVNYEYFGFRDPILMSIDQRDVNLVVYRKLNLNVGVKRWALRLLILVIDLFEFCDCRRKYLVLLSAI